MTMNRNEKAREVLFDSLDDVHSVMLGADSISDHMQPMAPLFDDDTESSNIWFFTNATSQLGSAAVIPTEARICLISKDEGVYACINGTMATKKDQSIIDKFWSPMVAAWFKGGQEDPELTTMCFTPKEAAIWVNEANVARFGFEIAKANLLDVTPDLGFRQNIRF